MIRMRISKIIYTAAALATLSLTACKKWLDAPAPLQVDQETLFSNEQGFKEVLNGVYLQMGSKALYGREMSYGLLSVLGRSYDTTITSAIGNLYYQGAQYNFQQPEVRSVIQSIWEESYSSIANINHLLANMDSRAGVFTGNNYNTIKGEALGLRAFLHLELLRLYAPSPAAGGLSAPAIPYVTRLSPYAVPTATTGLVLDSCIADLQTAESLLSEADRNTSRFTIWASRGLLARAYQYKGDAANALSYARKLIDSGKFPLAVTNSDLMFAKEHLFSLYTAQNDIANLYKTVFSPTAPRVPLGLSTTGQTALFVTGGGSNNDWRKAFLDPATAMASGNMISPRKFYFIPPAINNANTTTPLVRMTEMYYIAAECAAANNDLKYATDLLDTVRVKRNLPKYGLTALGSDSLNTEIRKEYQKEFLGEGQMFFYYKRKNLPFSSLPFTKTPVVAEASYVFPKPE
jgi:starch-binding outer membrane protein, SusD/RagB family